MKRLGLRLHADEEHWIPLADLMTGLMFLFLLISIAYTVAVKTESATSTNVLQSYAETRSKLYRALYREFNGDLPGWGGTLDEKTLSIRFYARNVLFAPGSDELQPRFQTILANFFPRYVSVLSRPEFRNIVSELRIEGYTGTFWRTGATPEESYLANMSLSQARTRSVLGYVLALPTVAPQEDWLMQVLTANGLSSSHLIRLSNGAEDAYASQRVEFRVRTNAEEQVRKLLALSATPAPAATPNPILVVDDSIPPYPDWAAPMIGKPLRTFYAKTSSRCLGYLDDVAVKYTGFHPGAKIVGWGFDTAASAPVARLLFADNNGIIVGAGEGGFQRPDVAARQPKIDSTTTGWEGYVEVTARPIAAWGIMSQPGTVCRFAPARLSSRETM